MVILDAYLIALNVVEPVTISEIFGNSTLAASCRAGYDEDVMMIGNRHFCSLHSVEGRGAGR